MSSSSHNDNASGTAPLVTFISPMVYECNRADQLQAEVRRRMELFLLYTLHSILLPLPSSPPSLFVASDATATLEAQRNGSRTLVADAEMHLLQSRNCQAAPFSFFASSPSSSSSIWSPAPVPTAHRSSFSSSFISLENLTRVRNELLVLRCLYDNVSRGVVSTQRDVYYRLVREVPDQTIVNRTVAALADALAVPRQALGVVAGTRGTVAGTLSYRGLGLCGGGMWEEGMPIPTLSEELTVAPLLALDMASASARSSYAFTLYPQTRFILVVEKHAIFHKLVQEGLTNRVPCVLVTSAGFPTVSARTLVRNLHDSAPHVPVVGLVDYNPSGIAILWQYKHGGMPLRRRAKEQGVERWWRRRRKAEKKGSGNNTLYMEGKEGKDAGARTAEERTARGGASAERGGGGGGRARKEGYYHYCSVPTLSWLGLRSEHFLLSSPSSPPISSSSQQSGQTLAECVPSLLPCQPLTARDRAMLRNFIHEFELSSQSTLSHDTHNGDDAEESITSEGASGYSGVQQAPPRLHETTATMRHNELPPHAHLSALPTPPHTWPVSWGECQASLWVREARIMQDCGMKVEVEALYDRARWRTCESDGGERRMTSLTLSQWVCKHLLRRDFL